MRSETRNRVPPKCTTGCCLGTAAMMLLESEFSVPGGKSTKAACAPITSWHKSCLCFQHKCPTRIASWEVHGPLCREVPTPQSPSKRHNVPHQSSQRAMLQNSTDQTWHLTYTAPPGLSTPPSCEDHPTNVAGTESSKMTFKRKAKT